MEEYSSSSDVIARYSKTVVWEKVDFIDYETNDCRASGILEE